jgi:hypothetical protein
VRQMSGHGAVAAPYVMLVRVAGVDEEDQQQYPVQDQVAHPLAAVPGHSHQNGGGQGCDDGVGDHRGHAEERQLELSARDLHLAGPVDQLARIPVTESQRARMSMV